MTELTFYEDTHFDRGMSGYDRSKLKLDLNSPSAISSTKRSLLSHVTSANTPGLLQSPDLKMLKLASPELERIIIQNHGLITTTPTPTGGNGTTNPNGTDEQENFARGFIEALQKLHENEVPGSSRGNSMAGEKLKQRLLPVTSSSRSSVVASNQSLSYGGRHDMHVRSLYKGENNNVSSIASVAAATSASFSFVDNKDGASVNASSTRTVQGGFVPGTDDVPYRNMPGNSTTISFPSGYTSSQAYDHGGRRLNHAVSEASSSKSNLTYTSLESKSGVAQAAVKPDCEPYSRVESHLGHVSAHHTPGLPVPVTISLNEGAQIVPSATPPPLPPIDLDVQEAIKHERKKLRNRLAAQRCRKRKIEREELLKMKVKELKTKNSELTSTASELRLQVCDLKQKVMNHVNQGCQVFVPQSSPSD